MRTLASKYQFIHNPSSWLSHQPLHHTLQSISELCTTAVLADSPPHVALFSSSVRRHFLSSARRNLYCDELSAYSRSPLHHSPDILDTAHQLHRFLTSVLKPPFSFSSFCDALYEALQHSHHSHDFHLLLCKLWDDLLMILRRHLHTWLVYATLADSHEQFFISGADDPQVCQDRLPLFVSHDIAERILFAGNARKCVILLRNEGACDVNLSPNYNIETLLKDPSRASLELDAITMRWRDTAAEQLSQVLPFNQVEERIYLLRQYLLLGNSTFWRSFFDELRARPAVMDSKDESLDSREEAERTLNQIFEKTSAELAEIDDGLKVKTFQEPPMKLTVTKSGELYPHFSLSFAESQVLSSRCSVYCDVFAVAFNVRRVACDLKASFASLQLLERKMRRGARTASNRIAVAEMVRVHELRRCMVNFIDGFEWYLQAGVLEPKFKSLLDLLRNWGRGKVEHQYNQEKAFFDIVRSKHEEILDKVFVQCFVSNEQVSARLEGIFTACFAFCDFVATACSDGGLQKEDSEFISSLRTSFFRNLNLLVRMLLHMQHGTMDSKVPALLTRINFNNYLG